jgi:hypothetical protein
VDPTAADDDASDVAVADFTAAENWRGVRENDTLYRRPPAHPPMESAMGGSWFSGGTEMPGSESAGAGQDDADPGTSGSSSRISFGFGDGPISPVRAPSQELPIRGKGTPPAGRKRSAPKAPPAPAARQAAPSESWPQATRRSHAESTLDPAPIGEHAAWSGGDDTGSWAGTDDTGGWSAGDNTNAGAWAAGDNTNAGSWAAADDSGARSAGDNAGSWSGVDDTGFAWPDEGAGARQVAHHEPPVDPARGPRQSRLVTAGIVLLSTVVLVGGGLAGVAYYSGSNGNVSSVLQLGAGKTEDRTVTAPLDNRTKASFELLAGTNAVHVTIGELGDDLYRISTPDDAGIRPNPVIRDDDVKLQVSPDGDGIGGEVDVVLAAKVRWALRFSGYAETQLIDVSGGQVSQIEMVAAMKRAELTLARPSGTVPLKINGSVDQLTVKSPSTSPVRIKVGGGVQSVVAGSRTLKDVAAGSTLTPKGWDTADRYDVTAGARINALTIESA